MKCAEIRYFDTCPSTNDYAKENAEKLETPALIIAGCQSGGRGRKGKSFYSPEGGIYFSLLFEADENFELITPACAVSVCEAIKEMCGIEAGIKWVNDIFYGGKKVCGILTERFSRDGRTYTCAGIGINLNTKEFPGYLPEAGSLGCDINGRELAELISEKLLDMNNDSSKNRILEEYESRLILKGKDIIYEINGSKYTGGVKGINEECNLLVENGKGETVTLKSGEISVKAAEN